MTTIQFRYSILLACILCCSSCKKFLAIPPPETQLESLTLFSNSSAAVSAAMGLYSQMMQSSLSVSNGAATLYPALSADELYNTAANADYDAFRSNNIQFASSTGLTRLWTFSYRNIYHANAVMEGLNASASIPDSLKKQLRGEMLVVRGFHYLCLLRLFGDVPLITSTSYSINQSMPRTATTEVYNQVETDLKEAYNLLGFAYTAGARTRPDHFTAAALLARLCIYRQNWPLAAQYASEVISSNRYALNPVLNNVFLSASNETIWQLSPVSTTVNTAEGNLFIPSSATTRPVMALTSWLLDAFEPGDQRKTSWLKTNTVGGQPYAYPYKYKVRTGAPPYSEMYVVIRLAELYLIRAEANLQLNNLTAAAADINAIRNRAGLPNTAYTTQPALLTALMQERRIELMFEWGHRWSDLKRTGTADAVLQTIKAPGWQPADTLYPIQQYELDTNPFLIQNPGY